MSQTEPNWATLHVRMSQTGAKMSPKWLQTHLDIADSVRKPSVVVPRVAWIGGQETRNGVLSISPASAADAIAMQCVLDAAGAICRHVMLVEERTDLETRRNPSEKAHQSPAISQKKAHQSPASADCL